MTGWTVLDHLKHESVTRHIPVHVISGQDDNNWGYTFGAINCVLKQAGADMLQQTFDVIEQSTERGTKNVLLVSQTEPLRQEVQSFVGGPDIQLVYASTTSEARRILATETFHAVILDWILSDGLSLELIQEVQTKAFKIVPAFLVFGSRKLTSAQAAELGRLGRTSVVRYASSLERLLEHSTIILHRKEDALSERQREVLALVRQKDPMLAGRKVLIIDDDLRNIFALTSVLEEKDLTILHADNGQKGLEVLHANPDIDVVLMDIMMPGMDGYETTRTIRRERSFEKLPIIALTAKAMKGDREKCLQAGASDYVTKPIDLDHLLSTIRVWVARVLETSHLSVDAIAEIRNNE
jgi:CheY-like chemotaxis protein